MSRDSDTAPQINSRFGIQIDVQNKAGSFRQVGARFEIANRAEQFNIEAIHPQHALNDFQHAGVVIHDQYKLSRLHASCPSQLAG
jgi:hypothetical protein